MRLPGRENNIFLAVLLGNPNFSALAEQLAVLHMP
jgi:hypothetical protein